LTEDAPVTFFADSAEAPMSDRPRIRKALPRLRIVPRGSRGDDLVVTLKVGELAQELAPVVRDAVREAVEGVTSPSNEVLTRKQAAALLGVNPHHIPRLIERGLPAHRLGNRWKFCRAELLAWLSNKEAI
jgi:excisionase family DNA binding protein